LKYFLKIPKKSLASIVGKISLHLSIVPVFSTKQFRESRIPTFKANSTHTAGSGCSKVKATAGQHKNLSKVEKSCSVSHQALYH
jgi:hypothetical protein